MTENQKAPVSGSQGMIQKLELLRNAKKSGKTGGGLLSSLSLSLSQDGLGLGAKKPGGLGLNLKGAIQAAEESLLVRQQSGGFAGASDAAAGDDDGDGSRASKRRRGGDGATGDKARALVMPGDGSERVERAHLLPMDWSLKTKAVFTSDAPFEPFTNSFAASPETFHQALRSFTGGNRRSRDATQMYLQSLFSWTFPLDPLPKKVKMLKVLASTNGPEDELKPPTLEGRRELEEATRQHEARYAKWREALRDLVYATYGGLCGCFYVLPPEGSSDAWVAMFAQKNVQGRRKVSASVSNANDGLCAFLKGYGLEFARPLASLLYFSGREEVHGLYDFLLNEAGRTYHKQCDTPILLAPVPFAGASVKCFKPDYRNYRQIKRGKKTGKKTGLEGLVGSEEDGNFHHLEVCGFLPPWTVSRLAETFRKSQQDRGGFEASFEVDKRTKHLNLNVVLLEEEDDEYHARLKPSVDGCGGGWWDTEEQDKWFAHPGKLDRKTVSKIKNARGVYNITFKQ